MKKVYIGLSVMLAALFFITPYVVKASTTVQNNYLSKSGTTTRDLSLSTGTQTIAHGLGVAPEEVNITFMCISSTVLSAGVITWDSSGTNGQGYQTNFGSNTTPVDSPRVFGCGGMNNGQYQTVSISVDSTNITLTWTKTSTPTGTAHLIWRANAKTTASINEEDNTCHVSAGTGISLSGCTITNSSPLSALTGGSGISISGTTVSNSSPEDGLSHIRFQEEGSDVIANPDVLNFVGSCITLTNPTSTITGLLTSTCGTGGSGGGGFGLTPGGTIAHAAELEATLNEEGDVMSVGLTDDGWNLLNEIASTLVFALAFGTMLYFINFFYKKARYK